MSNDTRKYQHLGIKAFWLFFFQNSKWIFFIICAIVVLGIIQSIFLLPDNLSMYLQPAQLGLMLLFYAVLIGTFLVSWLEYLAYEFSLDEHSIRIKKGIFNIQVAAIPYRQIQNVHIERDIFYRLVGVSRLIILTAGEDSQQSGNQSEGIIPALDKNLASKIQEELLQRANVERTLEVT